MLLTADGVDRPHQTSLGKLIQHWEGFLFKQIDGGFGGLRVRGALQSNLAGKIQQNNERHIHIAHGRVPSSLILEVTGES